MSKKLVDVTVTFTFEYDDDQIEEYDDLVEETSKKDGERAIAMAQFDFDEEQLDYGYADDKDLVEIKIHKTD